MYKDNDGSNKQDSSEVHKGVMKDCFILNIFLFSKKSVEAAVDVGEDIIFMVITNKKGLYKETNKNL